MTNQFPNPQPLTCRGLAPALEAMPALRELDLASNAIQDQAFLPIIMQFWPVLGEEKPTLALETVDMRGNRIGEEGAEWLLTLLVDKQERPQPLVCPRLASVYMDDNPAVRSPRGRECLQKVTAVTGIACVYEGIWG
jgi:Ran GTPase-activating protein (RanGAP) involved in mRNA processing and transport